MKKSIFFLFFVFIVSFMSSQTMIKLKLPNNCNAAPNAENDVLADKWLELFPNPNAGNFTLVISFKDNIEKAVITVYDTSGKAIYTETVFSNSNKLVKQLKISNLNKGTYLFEVKNAQQTTTTKLVINK